MWTSVVYPGEHYVLDVFTGAAPAGIAWMGVRLATQFPAKPVPAPASAG